MRFADWLLMSQRPRTCHTLYVTSELSDERRHQMHFSAKNFKNPIPELYRKTRGGHKHIAAWWHYKARGEAEVLTADIDTGDSGREHKVKGTDHDLVEDQDDRRQ